MLRHLLTSTACFCLLAIPASKPVAAQPLVELETRSDRIEGRVVDKGRGWCVLFDRYGGMHTVETDQVVRFRTLSPTFAPHPFNRVRTKLLEDFGKGYEVGTSRHYVVCAPAGRASAYADVFEETWRRLHMYFSVRGFEIPDPEFPLIAVVFRDRNSFLEYARKENARIDTNILGYYWSTHNRVLMYEDHRQSASREAGRAGSFVTHFEQTADPWDWAFADPQHVDQFAANPGVSGDLKETMIHEATHQLGYNLGLHNRVGRNPRWIVEGLATVFEAPGMAAQRSGQSISRANPGWLYGFRRFVETRRPKDYLAEYIRSDDSFVRDAGNAYAQAWALSFWLIETRPREYGQFLRRMAEDDVSKSLTADRRVEIFSEAFGDNLQMLDVEMLRYYERLN
ncbi:DUF1570 domain-containing protein [bacterium]|nr:DUF1570 domain-containing protein [bacterium]